VGRRLLRLEIPVFPERMMFRVHDPAVDPDAPGAPPSPIDSLISAGREQVIIATAQEHLPVQLTIEEWAAAPPPFSDGYEDEAKCVLYLRGQLTVADTGPSRRAIAGMRLAGGVGDYGLHVYTRNRAEVVRRYAALFEQNADPLGDEFQQARRQLEGLEQYLVQLWREA
jgi:hypothetical protein